MEIKKIAVGELATNCYLVKVDQGLIIIDPGAEADKIKREVGKEKLLTILVTHNHFDHIGALKELLSYYNVNLNAYNMIFNLQVINTPGHTSDSKTFYFAEAKVMFCGDFLFKDTFGRTDLETGSNQDMIKSLENILEYPNDITLYPGHGEVTNLGREKCHFKDYLNYLNS